MAIVFSAKITGVSTENLYSTGNYYTGQFQEASDARVDTEGLLFSHRIRAVLGRSRSRFM